MNARKYLYIPSGLVPVDKLIRLTSRKILLPFYHTISDTPLPHVNHLYTIRNTKQFISDIDFFCSHFEPISLSELFEVVIRQKPLKKPVFHLTFDDGLKGVYSIIAPILEKKSIPATFFLNTKFIDNKALFYRYKIALIISCIESNYKKHNNELPEIPGVIASDRSSLKQVLLQLKYDDQIIIDSFSKNLGIDFDEYLRTEQPYLKSDEVNDLIHRGFTIGSHSVDHPHFKEISLNDQKDQVMNSFTFLMQKFNIETKYFSFPFSDEGVRIEFFNWLYDTENCRLSFGTSGLKDDFNKRHLHRIAVESDAGIAEKIIKSEYLYFVLKSFLNKNKIQRT
jgi:peptidoglycan/xylan/chitin deacetylase (PgdA/CDA1 family)